MKNKKIFILLLIVPIIIFFVGRSFSYPAEQEQRVVFIDSEDYDEPGSFEIYRYVTWYEYDKATMRTEIDSILKTEDNRYKDIIIVLDTSGSMDWWRNYITSYNIYELSEYFLSNFVNRMALITFDTDSTIKKGFTSDKNEFLNALNINTSVGETNYNAAFKNIDVVMEDYIPKENTDLITLFITDGKPNVDTPNEVATYNLLKEKYPYMTVQGIQYEMGDEVVQELKNVSDNQWCANADTLRNVLFDATTHPVSYENYILTDYISEYFHIDSSNDIYVNIGRASLEEENGVQKVIWDLSGEFRAIDSVEMNYKLSLKDDYTNAKGIYPVTSNMKVDSKMPNEDNKVFNTEVTPTIEKKAYYVRYESNHPWDCYYDGYMISKEHYPFQNISIKDETDTDDILECPGYTFTGWEIDYRDALDIKKINDEMFEMPQHDVRVRGTWSKIDLVKSGDGKPITTPTLYQVMKSAYKQGYAKKYYGEHQDSVDASLSTKDIYYWYADKQISYYYGQVDDPTYDNKAKEIVDKYNVIFADQCWQMIRTTDTGGVKLLYNGEPEDGKCLQTRSNHLGYGYRNLVKLEGTYYYGTDYSYDETTNKFKLAGTINPYNVNDSNARETINDLKGKYTCKETTSTATCDTLYIVESYYETQDSYYKNSGNLIPISNNNAKYPYIGQGYYDSDGRTDSLAKVGYMYNIVYPFKLKNTVVYDYAAPTIINLNTSYWYADDVHWNQETNKYEMVNKFQVSSLSDASVVEGKYTFLSDDENATNAIAYYITDVFDQSIALHVDLQNGNSLEDVDNIMYIYSDNYVANNDGTFSLTNPTTIKESNWYKEFANFKNKYFCKNMINDVCEKLYFLSSPSYGYYSYYAIPSFYYQIFANEVTLFAKGFTYDGTKYILNNDRVLIGDVKDERYNKHSINNHHYTCFNTTGECTVLSYVYNNNYPDSSYWNHIELENGKSITDAINDMLYNDNVNVKDSTQKLLIEKWYEHYILPYDQYIEDTIYCNNRRQRNASSNRFNPNGGDLTTNLFFSVSYSLMCENETDRFSTLNNKAKTNYKVGMMTYPELELLNNDYILKFGNGYEGAYLLTPGYFEHYYSGDSYYYTGIGENGRYTENPQALRPMISLKPGIKYSDGDGTMEHPYIVNMEVD